MSPRDWLASRDAPAALLTALGRLVLEFSFLESTMQVLIADLAGMHPGTAGRVLTTHISYHVRRDALNALVNLRFAGLPAETEFKTIMADIEDVANKRHGYMHHVWTDDGTRQQIVKARGRLRIENVQHNADEIDKVAAKCAKTNESLINYWVSYALPRKQPLRFRVEPSS